MSFKCDLCDHTQCDEVFIRTSSLQKRKLQKCQRCGNINNYGVSLSTIKEKEKNSERL